MLLTGRAYRSAGHANPASGAKVWLALGPAVQRLQSTRGAEVEWQHAWGTGWRVRANASTSLAADRDTGTPIAVYAPRYVANLTAIAPVARDVQAGLQWRAVARRGGAGAYTLANLSLASGVSDTGWSWSANLQNAFDRRYGDPGTDLSAQPSIGQAGRSVEFTLTKAFK